MTKASEPRISLLSRAREWLSRRQAAQAADRQHAAKIARAIEQTVDQVNPRLRAARQYRKRLHPVVGAVLAYAEELARRVPGPLPVDRARWAQDPTVNALFGSVEQMRLVLTSPAVRRYVQENPLGGDCFAVLASMPETRRQLGMDLVGERVQRDVSQTTVGFVEQEVALPGADESAVRQQLVGAAREILVGIAAEHLLARESQIAEAEERLRVVRIQARAAGSGARGTALITGGQEAQQQTVASFQARIVELERELVEARKGMAGLDEYLDRLTELLAVPQTYLALQAVNCRLDRMNILRQEGDGTASAEITFQRALRRGKPARVVQLIRFPRAELLEEHERLRGLQNYL